MADNYQEALIKAIETISKSQVDSLATDKTVTATIASCSDLLTNEYKVSYLLYKSMILLQCVLHYRCNCYNQ